MQADYAILCPMQEELEATLRAIKTIKAPKIEINGKKLDDIVLLNCFKYSNSEVLIYRNEKDKNPIKVLISKIGVGRAASSYNFGKIESQYSPKKVIICGVAGACTRGLRIGDVVYNKISKVIDFNLGEQIISGLSKSENDGFDYKEKIEYTPIEESFFSLNQVMPSAIVTTDSFVYEEQKQKISEEMNNIIRIAVDMESAHLYYLCRKQNIPCIVFRGISDEMEGEAESDFETNLPIAAENAAEITWSYIMEMDNAKNEILSKIEFVKDFPKKGVNFLDIQSILKYPEAVDLVMDELVARVCNIENKITKIVALDARGFILGTLLADRLNLPLIMARKKGKLPTECYESAYEKEYGTDIIQIEKSALAEGDRILVADDIAVTFGSVNSVIDCVEQAKAKVVGIAVFATIDEAGKASNYTEAKRVRSSEDLEAINVYSIFNF